MDVKEIKIKSGDAGLFCRIRGRGPALLLIHGVACDADYFEAAARCLSKTFTVITYDRRGYSRSLVGDSGRFSVADQAEDAAAIWRYCRKDLGNDARVFVVGSSAGSLVAAEFARLYPEMVSGLFLHEPVFGGDEPMKAEIQKLRENLYAAAKKHHVVRGMRIFLEAMGGMDARAPETPMEKLAQNMKNLEIFLYHEMDDFLSYDMEKIKGLAVPAWIAVGECDAEGIFRRAAESAAPALGWRLVHVPGYHNFPIDLPEEFAMYVCGCYCL